MPRVAVTVREVRVIHRGSALLVLEKPAFVPTTSPDPAETTLVALARELDPDAPLLHPSSRLDAEVTGVVIFARTRPAIAALLEARQAGRYARGYLGLAGVAPAPEAGEWRGAIGVDARDKRKRSVVPDPDPRAQVAHTRYRVLAATARCALLWLEPLTGRTHQLRVHAEHAGCALLGDRAYGGPARLVLPDGRVVAPRRVQLHCARVSVPDPDGGAALRFEAPPPADMRQIWQSLAGAEIELP
jgi:23S rRNA-/tRNA-specific pseudouridylate synthase